ncbi:hypothetical protein RJ639_012018 [Escallonia herrerae]|uniref:F-box domain-containing protein n=1 Tax=Escallonia herrerae TaxID=1293975 RepID=A0AA88VND8_9ASTE|nr:hypothetical protein RJ639_012018 [Escallonia herrerae]
MAREREFSHGFPSPGPYPWLTYIHEYFDEDPFFCTMPPSLSSSKHVETRSIPYLRGKAIEMVCYGWLILHSLGIDNHDYFSILNPITSESIDLPPLKVRKNLRSSRCVLSLPPGNHDSALLIFRRKKDSENKPHSIQFCSLLHRKWKKTWYHQIFKDDDDVECYEFLCRAVNMSGKLYAITELSKMLVMIDVVLDPREEDSTELVIRSLGSQLPILNRPFSCFHFTWWNLVGNFLSKDYLGDSKVELHEEDQGEKAEEVEMRVSLGADERIHIMAEKREALEWHLLDLPYDMLRVIAEHTVLVDYLNFRATSKLCRAAAPPVQWRTASKKLLQTQSSISPWLMLQADKKKGVVTYVDPKFGNRYFMTSPESVGDATICYSKDGWLLMITDSNSMIFFNPFSRTTIQLPPMPSNSNYYSSFGFSSLPTSSDCVVVGVTSQPVQLDITTPGRSEWVRCVLYEVTAFAPCRNNPVFYEGLFYFLGRDGHLVDLVVDEDLGCFANDLDDIKSPCDSFCQNFLVECDGNLLSVFVSNFWEWVKVFKLNLSESVWEEVESLGNHMIYVSDSTSFSTVAKTPGMENKIYFPRFSGDNIIFYSLSTCKFYTFGSMEPLMAFHNAGNQLQCGWIDLLGA